VRAETSVQSSRFRVLGSEFKVKICGLTNIEDARFAAISGADLLGFIFYEPSPRYAPPAAVKEIVTTLKAELVAGASRKGTYLSPGVSDCPKLVGVFVNAPLAEVERVMAACCLDLVQLHGDEPPEFVHYFAGRAFKAGNPRSLAEAETLAQQYLGGGPAAMILLDAYHPHLHGGTGQAGDWDLAAQIAKKYPLLLAGGLNPDNVAQAIQTVNPWGVDVSSGVEATKGKKDHLKVKAFIETVKRQTR